MNPEWVGMTAAVLTTVSFAPQAIRVIRTRDTAAISLAMYALFLAGITFWEIYGLMIGSAPVILANAVTIILASIIFFYKLRDWAAARRHAAARRSPE